METFKKRKLFLARNELRQISLNVIPFVIEIYTDSQIKFVFHQNDCRIFKTFNDICKGFVFKSLIQNHKCATMCEANLDIQDFKKL